MARGSRREPAFCEEVDPGVLPYQPAFQIIPTTGGKIVQLTRDKIDNPEFFSDRSVRNVYLGANKVAGDVQASLCFGDFDQLLAGGLFGVWTHKVGLAALLPQTLTVTITSNTLTRGSGSWLTDGFRAGDRVRIQGMSTAANKKIWTITSLTASALTITGLAAEATTSVTVVLAEAKAPVATTVSGLTITSNTITRATGSFVTDGWAVGDTVVISGDGVQAGNNSTFAVTSVTALALGVTGVVASAATSLRLRQKQFLRDSVVPKTFAFERRQVDASLYTSGLGMMVSKLSLSMAPSGLVKVSFDLLGLGFNGNNAASVANSVVQPTGNKSFDTLIGSMTEGGSSPGIIPAFEVTVDNGLTQNFGLFQTSASELIEDDTVVTGSLDVYLRDKTLLDKFTNGTETAIVVTNTDYAGNSYEFTLPRDRYLSADEQFSKKNVSYKYPFQALRDPVNAYHIQIARTPA